MHCIASHLMKETASHPNRRLGADSFGTRPACPSCCLMLSGPACPRYWNRHDLKRHLLPVVDAASGRALEDFRRRVRPMCCEIRRRLYHCDVARGQIKRRRRVDREHAHRDLSVVDGVLVLRCCLVPSGRSSSSCCSKLSGPAFSSGCLVQSGPACSCRCTKSSGPGSSSSCAKPSEPACSRCCMMSSVPACSSFCSMSAMVERLAGMLGTTSASPIHPPSAAPAIKSV